MIDLRDISLFNYIIILGTCSHQDFSFFTERKKHKNIYAKRTQNLNETKTQRKYVYSSPAGYKNFFWLDRWGEISRSKLVCACRFCNEEIRGALFSKYLSFSLSIRARDQLTRQLDKKVNLIKYYSFIVRGLSIYRTQIRKTSVLCTWQNTKRYPVYIYIYMCVICIPKYEWKYFVDAKMKSVRVRCSARARS